MEGYGRVDITTNGEAALSSRGVEGTYRRSTGGGRHCAFAGQTWALLCLEASCSAAESDVLEQARSALIEAVGSASGRVLQRHARWS
jgi:hypothetical protein